MSVMGCPGQGAVSESSHPPEMFEIHEIIKMPLALELLVFPSPSVFCFAPAFLKNNVTDFHPWC
jgi:hypothetical protein